MGSKRVAALRRLEAHNASPGESNRRERESHSSRHTHSQHESARSPSNSRDREDRLTSKRRSEERPRSQESRDEAPSWAKELLALNKDTDRRLKSLEGEVKENGKRVSRKRERSPVPDFKYKRNRTQYEFNSKVLNTIETALEASDDEERDQALTEGFWLKEASYKEQPEVHFKHQYVVFLQGLTSDSYVAYSTYQNFNNLVNDKLRIPVTKSYEEDTNRDGKNDVLHFTLEMPLSSKESIYTAQLLLIFEYKLQRFSTLLMESMAYIHHTSGIPGAQFITTGELRLKQKYLLRHSGRTTTYNQPVIDSTSVLAKAYDFAKIFDNYFKRNVTTEYASGYPVWKSGRNTEATFTLKATIHYPEERIFYRPGFWQLIKHAWIQYLAVLVIFLALFSRIKRFVFENQIVMTVPQKIRTEHLA